MKDEQIVSVGVVAPEFTLEDANGVEVGLAASLAEGHVILYFLRAFH